MDAKTIGRLLCGALVLAGTSAGAQEAEMLANARMLVADGRALLAAAGVRQDGPALLKEIAAARVAMDVEGDLGAVEKTLDELASRASTGKGFEGQAEVLVQLALARADLYVRLGQRAKALEAVSKLDRFTLKLGEGVTIPPPSQASAQAAERDPRLVARREQLEREAGQGSEQAESSLKSVLDDCIARGDWSRIVNIGAPAAEYLGRLALDSANGFPERVDPLEYLVKIDERYAVHLLLEHFDAGGALWKKRILRALRANNALNNTGTWTSSPPHVCLEPELLRLFERLLSVPETATDSLSMLFSVEQNDAWTEGLAGAIARGLAALGPEFATATLQLFDGNTVSLGARPVFEAALQLSDVRMRRLAAQKLVHYERSEALLARGDDPDPLVRLQVVKALGPHSGQLYRQGNDAQPVRWEGPITGRDVPLLRRFLADADASVRAAAVRKLDDLEAPLEDAVYDTLSQDPSARVRAQLVGVERLSPDLRRRLLGVLAADPAAEVVAAVDEVLREAVEFQEGGSARDSGLAKDPRPYLPALEARFADGQQPLEDDLREWLVAALRASDEGLRALVAAAFASGNPAAVNALTNVSPAARFLALTDESLAHLLASSTRAWGGVWNDLWDALDNAQPRRGAALRLLLANPAASRTVRLTAATLAADGTPAFRDALLKLLELPTWKEQPLEDKEREQLAVSAETIPESERNVVLLAVVRDAAIPLEVATLFVNDYPLGAPGSRELTQAVLERWFRPEVPANAAVEQALRHLGSLPELARPELLQKALLVPGYSMTAIEAMAGLRDIAYLPALGRALQAEWFPVNGRGNVQRAAAYALASFTTEAAAPYLLEGLKSSDAGVRKGCQDGLDRIEEYDRRARAWRDRAVTPPTKESALAELVTMLGDEDPVLRRQAALGLGTLGATETIPQLIRLLKDSDPSVSRAAQQALDRLNAQKTGGG